jgi:hypothetical protein
MIPPAKLLIFFLLLLGCRRKPAPDKNSIQLIDEPVLGTPKRIGIIEIAENDIPGKLNWNDAKKACEDLGANWRLPGKEELRSLYRNKDTIGRFSDQLYWNAQLIDSVRALAFDFQHGKQDTLYRSDSCRVRAVRNL